MTTINLWGDLPEIPKVRTPEQILREQAAEITRITNGKIVGEVDSKASYRLGAFAYRLRLQVPTLNNYNVSVLEIGHEIGFYPARMISTLEEPILKECQDEAEFLSYLGNMLTSEACRKIIRSLLSHIASQKGD